MSLLLAGRPALTPGASRGMGRAGALELARAGAAGARGARNEAKLAAVAAEIKAAGGTASVYRMDVAKEDEIKSATRAMLADLGKIDILVNNAGITRDMLVMRMKRSDWDDVINTNLTGAFLCIQAVIASMLKQRWGRIVNISSINGQVGAPGQANYAASKAGSAHLSVDAAD